MKSLVTNVSLFTMIFGHRQQLKCSIFLGFSLLLDVRKLNFNITQYVEEAEQVQRSKAPDCADAVEIA